MCHSFCNCQMLCLARLYDPTKTYLGIFWGVIMFGLLQRHKGIRVVYFTKQGQLGTYGTRKK